MSGKVTRSVFPSGEAIHNPPLTAANPDAAVLLRLDAEIVCTWLGKGRYKGSFAEVIQAMIGAHPNAPVAPISKDGRRSDRKSGHRAW